MKGPAVNKIGSNLCHSCLPFGLLPLVASPLGEATNANEVGIRGSRPDRRSSWFRGFSFLRWLHPTEGSLTSAGCCSEIALPCIFPFDLLKILFFMQIQRVKTLYENERFEPTKFVDRTKGSVESLGQMNESDHDEMRSIPAQSQQDLAPVGSVGSTVITKDYFKSNPVFYYCYRIFPFERGHGVFVANSIRRFLLYEIPTIAITSVLIHARTKEDEGVLPMKLANKVGNEILDPTVNSKEGVVDLNTEKFVDSDTSEKMPPGTLTTEAVLDPSHETGTGASQLSEPSPTVTDSQLVPLGAKPKKPAVVKKKKVTKKALKEQAAELFSYTSDNFPLPVSENLDTEEVSSLTEFTTIPFVRESFLEILLNLKACVFENISAFDDQNQGELRTLGPSVRPTSKVLKGKLILNASEEALNDPTELSKELFFQKDFSLPEPTKLADRKQRNFSATQLAGETEGGNMSGSELFGQGRKVRQYKIWAKDLILPPGLKVRNPDHVIATLVAPKTNCELELNFEQIFQPDLTTLSMKTGRHPYRAEEKRRNVPIDGTLFPIKKVNFALSYTKFQKEVITFEIWTNGALNPREAIFQSVEKILGLFQTLRKDQVKEIDPFAETALDEFESEFGQEESEKEEEAT